MSACRQHCWHRMAYAHAFHAGPGREHIDEVCCHCGLKRCRTVNATSGAPDAHGPHDPARAGQMALETGRTIRMIAGEPVQYVPTEWVGS